MRILTSDHNNCMYMIWHHDTMVNLYILKMGGKRIQIIFADLAKLIQLVRLTENTLLFMRADGDKIIIV